MLNYLHIKNIALIDELNIEFAQGLNILSGETGAGKSIIVDSLNLILGERADYELIRSGETSAMVEAFFDELSSEAKRLIYDNGINTDEGIIISRELNCNGKSVCRVNGRLVTLTVLKEIAETLADLHGQHEHQSLFYDKYHIDFLDLYGGEKLNRFILENSKAYDEYTTAKKEYDEFFNKTADREKQIDILQFQIDEIEKAKLREGELEELTHEQKLLLSAEKISEVLNLSFEEIYANPGGAILPKLKASFLNLEGISHLDERYLAQYNRLSEIYYLLEECAYDIRDLKDEVYFNSNKLEEIENRIYLINKLMRKYGSDVGDVLEFFSKCCEDLESLLQIEDTLNTAKQKLLQALADLEEKSELLTQKRTAVARLFEKAVTNELKEVGLSSASFEVDIQKTSSFGARGQDKIEFMISTNLGEPKKQLKKIASGGEVSRIMLAMKVLSAKGGVNTLVFDEIDTGISGNMAHVVAKKLAKIAQEKQVICVTHLPQIAAKGEKHFLITKAVKNKHTLTGVKPLNPEERAIEIARLAGGETQSAILHAKELLNT